VQETKTMPSGPPTVTTSTSNSGVDRPPCLQNAATD
jgi:hypothetical protein